MVKKLLILALIIIGIGLIYMSANIISQSKIKSKVEVDSQLPQFAMDDLDNNEFNSNHLPSGKYIIIKYINSECHLCEEEVSSIIKFHNSFDNAFILLISAEEKEKLKSFATKYNLSQFQNIKILHDENDEFDAIFLPSSVPTTFVYDPSHQLLEHIQGNVQTQYLITLIN